QAGDVILLTALEHHANIVPWQQVAQKKGVVLHYIPVRSDGTLDETTYETLFDDRVKLVAVTHVSNALGTTVDLVPLRTYAKKIGAKFLVDAAQSAPHGLVQ